MPALPARRTMRYDSATLRAVSHNSLLTHWTKHALRNFELGLFLKIREDRAQPKRDPQPDPRIPRMRYIRWTMIATSGDQISSSSNTCCCTRPRKDALHQNRCPFFEIAIKRYRLKKGRKEMLEAQRGLTEQMSKIDAPELENFV